MKKGFILSVILIAVFVMAGCSLRPDVTRVEASQQTDISGYWNDTDSRMVAESMIAEAVTYPWIADFNTKYNQPPKMVIGIIRNKSHEHINMDTFMNDIQRELIKQGKVRFLVSGQERAQVQEEKDYIASKEAEVFNKGREQGADFIIMGEVSSILDEAGKVQVRYYQVDLQFVNLSTGEKVWIGQKKIKKVVRQPGF